MINVDSLLKQTFVLSKIVRVHSVEAKERCEMSIDIPTGGMFRSEETVARMGITESQLKGGKGWIKNHKGTDVLDTPLWVLISLGAMAIHEEEDDGSKKG